MPTNFRHQASTTHLREHVGIDSKGIPRGKALMARQRGYRLAEERKRNELTQAELA